MPFITFDDSSVKTAPAPQECPPAGEYTVQILEATIKNSKRGNNMLELKCQMRHERYHNTLYYYIVNTGDNARLMQDIYDVLDSCGRPPKKGQAIGPESFTGLTGTVKLVVELYNGESRPKINYFKHGKQQPAPAQEPVTTPEPEPSPAESLPF